MLVSETQLRDSILRYYSLQEFQKPSNEVQAEVNKTLHGKRLKYVNNSSADTFELLNLVDKHQTVALITEHVFVMTATGEPLNKKTFKVGGKFKE